MLDCQRLFPIEWVFHAEPYLNCAVSVCIYLVLDGCTDDLVEEGA